MRNKEQGDFTDEQMQELQALQPHFACVIRRMARHQETRLVDSSLRHFMSSLPTATLILDWNLKVLHYNSIASQLVLPVEERHQHVLLQGSPATSGPG